MSLPARRLDIAINKNAQFYQEIYLVEDDVASGIPLTGKTLFGSIKESHRSMNTLINLTETSGTLVKLDEAKGVFAISLPATMTNVTVANGVVSIYIKDDEYPTERVDRILEGKVTFSAGA